MVALFVLVIHSDTGELLFREYVVDLFPSLTILLIWKKRMVTCLLRAPVVQLPMTRSVVFLSMCSDTLSSFISNPISVIIFEQNTASFIDRATATVTTSIVDMTVRLCVPDLEVIGAFATIVMYDDIDLPLLRLFTQMESQIPVGANPPFWQVILESVAPASERRRYFVAPM